jgi:hypothetical protein
MLFDLAAFGMETLTSLSASCKKALMQGKSLFFQPAVIIDKALLSDGVYDKRILHVNDKYGGFFIETQVQRHGML